MRNLTAYERMLFTCRNSTNILNPIPPIVNYNAICFCRFNSDKLF